MPCDYAAIATEVLLGLCQLQILFCHLYMSSLSQTTDMPLAKFSLGGVGVGGRGAARAITKILLERFLHEAMYVIFSGNIFILDF